MLSRISFHVSYGRQVAEKGKTLIFGSQPRGTYTDVEIDDMLASRDKRKNGGGSGAGGGNDQPGGDEDADGMMTRVISIYGGCVAAVTLGVDDMSSGKVFLRLTLVDLVNTFPMTCRQGNFSP
uniref:Uncharacterized protein n=1 Tax=Tanacetum cinerariifolium TaxID=118510 RepID=A0A699JC12_TANCI|nr:hypothetical protein [Tanacetum cinerariifolium]